MNAKPGFNLQEFIGNYKQPVRQQFRLTGSPAMFAILEEAIKQHYSYVRFCENVQPKPGKLFRWLQSLFN